MRELAEDAGGGRCREETHESTVVARFNARSRVARGEASDVAVDTSELHFFDPETGLGIYGNGTHERGGCMTRYRWAIAGTLALALTALVAAGTAGGAHKQRGVSGNISIIAKWTGDEQKSFEAVLAWPSRRRIRTSRSRTRARGDDAPQVISTAIAGGNPPDIGTMPQPGTMADFAKGNKLKPITFAKPNIAQALRQVLGQRSER